MAPPAETLQRIARFTPLADIRARLDAIAAPVAMREADPAAAVCAILARDVVAPRAIPPSTVAMRDGWAVAAEQVLDAGPYAPVPLNPPPAWVENGQALPPGADAVLPADAVAVTKAGAEAHAPASPGEGLVPAGADAAAGTVLLAAGRHLRPADAAALRLAGIESVSVRAPRVKIFSVTVPTRSRADAISPLIARAVEGHGGVAQVAQAATLESALADRSCDAVITIGGTGAGKRDAAVKTLARVGKVELHGLGISPGETAALGMVDGRPVLMLPGRLDAALAAFLIVGREMLVRLSGAAEDDTASDLRLTRKVASTVGIAELVLVRRKSGETEPLGTGFFPLQAIAQADGWFVVPPESEGFAQGATVGVKDLP